MSISQNFPEEGPTLNLNFAGSRTLDPRITFSRSQTTSNGSSYMDENGLIRYAGPDEPRFDHRYVNGEVESLGLLIEEQRTNLIIHSENQNNWSGFRTDVSINQIFSPDGNMTADLITASETNGSGGAKSKSFTPSVGTFTFSVFAKKNTTSTLLLRPQSTDDFSQASDAYFNLETGEKAGVSDDGVVFTNSTQDIEEYGNNWYRCYVTFTLTNGNFNGQVRIYVVNNPNSLSVDEDKSLYVWGAQLEQGSFPTSYIPTDGTSGGKTRNPDNVSMTGTNFTDWFNSSEGTLYASASILGKNIHTTGVKYPNAICKISDTESDHKFSRSIYFFDRNPERVYFSNRDSITLKNLFENIDDDIQLNQYYKVCGAYINNDKQALCINGGIIRSNETNINPPIPNQFLIGTGYNGAIADAPHGDEMYLNGHISQLTYYPTRLSDTQLQTLTK